MLLAGTLPHQKFFTFQMTVSNKNETQGVMRSITPHYFAGSGPLIFVFTFPPKNVGMRYAQAKTIVN